MLQSEAQKLFQLLAAADSNVRNRAHFQVMEAMQAGDPCVMQLALQGMSDSNPRIRRWCADLMDHYGNDACVGNLSALLHDPVPKVRRAAVHSLCCQRCKASPLSVDSVPTLIEIITNDPNRRVRQEAIYGLQIQPRDERAIACLRNLLITETDPILKKCAHDALCHQDNDFWEETKRAAKQRGMAWAQTPQQVPVTE